MAPPLPIPEAGEGGELSVLRMDGESVVWADWTGHKPDRTWAWEVLDAVLLDITAEDAPLSAITASITEQTGLSIGVEASVGRRAITIRRQLIPLSVLLDELQRWGVVWEPHHGGINLSDQQTWAAKELQRVKSQEESRSLLVLMVPLSQPAAARPILETWCTHYASSQGEGAVLGDQLLLKDYDAPLNAGRDLIRAFDGQMSGLHFSCAGKPHDEPVPREVPPVAQPGWSLSVMARPHAEPEAVEPASLARSALMTVPFDVDAQGAPAGALGMALSEATGIDVGVSPHAAMLPVTMSLRGASLGDLIAALSVSGVWMTRGPGAMVWMRARAAMLDSHRARDEELSAPVTEVWPLLSDASPAPELWVWCEMMASPQGKATLLSESVVVSGQADELAQLRELLRAAEATPSTE